MSTGAEGMVTLRNDGRRGRVTTGVDGAWPYDEEAAEVRAARIDSGAARDRYDTFGWAFQVAWICAAEAEAPEIEAKLGPPKALWMRCEGTATRAMLF